MLMVDWEHPRAKLYELQVDGYVETWVYPANADGLVPTNGVAPIVLMGPINNFRLNVARLILEDSR